MTDKTPSPTHLTVTLDLGTTVAEDEGDYDAGAAPYRVDMRAAIVDAAARQLAGGFDYETKREIQNTAQEVIREKVTEAVEKSLATELQQTNSWGEAEGPRQSLRDLIVQQANEYMTPKKDNFSQRRDDPFAKLLQAQVYSVLDKELTALMKDARQKVIDAVAADAAGLIAKAVESGLKNV